MNQLIAIADKYSNGKNVLHDWVGEGLQAAPAALAQARANVCIGADPQHPCPFNKPEAAALHLFGEVLKKIVEIKNQAQLRVEGEKRLHGCDGCGCHLRTKIWTPMSHIRKYTSDAELLKLPAYCWQRKENNL